MRQVIFTSTLIVLTACGGVDINGAAQDNSRTELSSNQATLLNFEFDGRLVTDSEWNAERQIQDQLLFTIGQLNGDRAVGRLDRLVLTNIEKNARPDSTFDVTYHAVLPVGWGSKTDLPTQYELQLPINMTYDGQQKFFDSYHATCTESGHEVEMGSIWYYYRPNEHGCSLADADVTRPVASVTVSSENTSGKYPEYDMVWSDNALTLVAIFGKFEEGATDPWDAGISAYNSFVRVVSRRMRAEGTLETLPTNVPSNPGVAIPDITFSVKRTDGSELRVVALLVDSIRSAGPEFDARYAELSGNADIIAYNGHSGLGANTRALARKGRYVAGQYQIVFMNGCDTFAYVDSAIANAKKELNPDDVNGTKYLDMVTNVMPAYFHSDAGATMALMNGLLSQNDPMTYDEIFENIDDAQVVVVTGEEDNAFTE